MKSIKEEILRIFSYAHDLLKTFDKEHQAMSAELRKDLANGEVERLKEAAELRKDLANGEIDRLKEFDVIMKGIRIEIKGIQKAVAELLGDYAKDREGASAAWKKITEILAQLRNTAVAPPKQVVGKAEKKEVKMETPVEAVKEIPVEVQPKVEPKPVVPITLEEKVLNYINKHPKGVKVSEMEVPLGETRMKLGFTAKALLDKRKVQKVENVYFPLK